LLSQHPVSDITTIYLDYKSKTSNNLVKIISENYWKVSPAFKNSVENYELINFKNNNAAVVIGDKAFNVKHNYPYVYDLAEEWYNFTRLPFVFACWVANKEIAPDFKIEFNNSLKYGIEHVTELVKSNYKGVKKNKNIEAYYKQNISYVLDKHKRQAMELFFEYLEKL